MTEKEKYSDIIQVINGKESFKATLKSCYEDDIFEDDPNKAWDLIKDDPNNIGLFSIRYLKNHQDMVDYVISRTFAGFIVKEKNPLDSIPYMLLRERYLDVLKMVRSDGTKLKFVPKKLQDEYVQIPMEAVKNHPSAIVFASVDALISYPDISIYACAMNWNNYALVPIAVRVKYPLKKYVFEYKSRHGLK